jgi:hypothetical protein
MFFVIVIIVVIAVFVVVFEFQLNFVPGLLMFWKQIYNTIMKLPNM